MVRIAGIDLPKFQNVAYALTRIYGIGIQSAKNILKKLHINFNIKINNLTNDQISNIREIVESAYNIESNLKRLISLNKKRLIDINCYRGKRHRDLLPVRGQRTRTNSRTRRISKKSKVSLIKK